MSPTTIHTGTRRRLLATTLAPATSALLVALATLAPAAGAAPVSVEECIAARVKAGATKAVATAECLRGRETAPAATTKPRVIAATTTPATSPKIVAVSPAGKGDDASTSTGVVVLVGLLGLAVGAAGATALRGRRRTTGPALASMPPPTLVAVPAGPPPSDPDRAAVLVGTLIDLSDRVQSQALRAEILAALDRADVHAIEIPAGEVFDPTRMRGVESAPAPDPSWVGRAAATERCGFHDGGRIVRQPEVVVYTAAG